jgi:hypothetical protein
MLIIVNKITLEKTRIYTKPTKRNLIAYYGEDWVNWEVLPDDLIDKYVKWDEAQNKFVEDTERAEAVEREKIDSLTISQRELRLWMLDKKGMTAEDIKTALQTNPQGLIEFEYASIFRRSHPLFDSVGALLGITSEEIDQMFMEAEELYRV